MRAEILKVFMKYYENGGKIMKQYGFGVDIRGTTCKLGLFGVTGDLFEKWEIREMTYKTGLRGKAGNDAGIYGEARLVFE